MDKNRRFFSILFAGVCAITVALIGASDIGSSFVMTRGNNVDKSKAYVFDETTRDGYNYSYSSVESFKTETIEIDPHFHLELTNVARSNDSKNWFCRMAAGSKIAKVEESYNITAFSMNYSQPDSRYAPVIKFYENKGDTEYYAPTYPRGTFFQVTGYNYFTIESAYKQNVEFSICYGCTDKIEDYRLEAKLKDDAYIIAGEEFSKDIFEVKAVSSLGEAIISPENFNISYSENFLEEGGDIEFTYGEKHTTIHDIELIYKVDTLRLECEDSTIVGATGITQLKEFNNPLSPVVGTEYVTSGATCGNCLMHAAAYLNYLDDSEAAVHCSGKEDTLGGLVHNFDYGKSASMTFKFESDEAKYAILKVRAASNIDNSKEGKIDPLNLKSRVNFMLNGELLNSQINENLELDGNTPTSSSPFNRTGTVGTFSLDKRYRFINWSEKEVCMVKIRKGMNVLKLSPTAESGSGAGQWDYVEIIGLDKTISEEDFPKGIKVECEDLEISNAKILKQTKEVSSYKDLVNGTFYDNCSSGEFHAQAYLGYQGTPYECSGSDSYGGFVHNFNNPSSMTYTFVSNEETDFDLYVRGCSDKGKAGNETNGYTIEPIVLSQGIAVTMNGQKVDIDKDAKFDGMTTPFKDSVNGRTGSAGGISLDGRYIMLLWQTVYVGTVHVVEGTNTLVISASSSWGNSHGSWDYIELI